MWENTAVKNNVTIGENRVLHLNQALLENLIGGGWLAAAALFYACVLAGPFLSDGDTTGGLTL